MFHVKRSAWRPSRYSSRVGVVRGRVRRTGRVSMSESVYQYPKGPMFPEIVVKAGEYPLETLFRAVKAMEDAGVESGVIRELYRQGWPDAAGRYVTVTRD